MESLTNLNKLLPSKSNILATVLRALPGFLIAVLVAWGTVQYTRGTDNQRLTTVEKVQEESLEHQLTREEFQIFREEQREAFRDLKDDVRQLRARK
jgi:hypothetical protein